ncbi:ABC transporter ATP-binding protein [Kitasatospora phosalacinea]|uniref:ABC transporter ATP-binding protein n=1 Tax=Kitasatospora phosalacinea TaxID=2065 RepID=A0A9W6V3N9_9ACTN|nr:ATP-binding cassette domain-containing protein [Kitasatospora phosalacinea]GLW72408.1 ABC transporter ATP-binding protein [Kitasatospora phosalacinea]
MGRHRRAPGGRGLRELAAVVPRRAVWRLAGWSAVEALPALCSGLLVAAAADRGFLAGRPGTGFAWLGVLGAVTALRALAARAVFPHLAEVVEPLRDALVARVVHGALSRPDPDGPAEIARITEQVESARQLTATLLRSARGVGFGLVAALLGLGLLAPPVLPLVLLPLLLSGVLFVRLLGPLVARRRAVVLADERIAAEAGRAFAGLRDVAACGAQQRVSAHLSALVEAQGEALRSVGRAAAARSLTVAVGGRLPLLAVVCAAPWLVGRGWLTAGQVLGVATYLLQQLEPAVRALAGMLGSWLLDLAVVLDRLTAACPAPPPAPVPAPAAASAGAAEAARAAGAAGGDGSLRVEGLRFAHPGSAEPALEGVQFELHPGAHLAVVGPSGTGKSTLAALLAGVLSPDAGRVLLGGQDAAALPAPSRAARLALVPQEAYVFAGTVRENLCWPSGAHSDAELATAAHRVGSARLLARLGGPDGRIAAPAALSAGERQLLALTRAFLSPAPVVVLDEATCHLDAEAELRAEEAFAARPGTLVVIAHRIGSAARADRVLLLDAPGPLLASHADLQVLSPFYRACSGGSSADEHAPSGARGTAGPSR